MPQNCVSLPESSSAACLQKVPTDEQLKDSVARIKKGYEEYRKLAKLHTAYMEKHEEVAEGVFEITYSDGSVIRVDYNEKCYEIINK